jgi:hypothetical protein
VVQTGVSNSTTTAATRTASTAALGIDVGYIYYDYPQDEGVLGDYEEVYANVSFGGFSAGVAFSDEYWFETGEIVYTKRVTT